jgi:hypothetical protein
MLGPHPLVRKILYSKKSGLLHSIIWKINKKASHRKTIEWTFCHANITRPARSQCSISVISVSYGWRTLLTRCLSPLWFQRFGSLARAPRTPYVNGVCLMCCSLLSYEVFLRVLRVLRFPPSVKINMSVVWIININVMRNESGANCHGECRL